MFYERNPGDPVRVKAKKLNGPMVPDYRKFSVDPQITTFEVLQTIVTRAFDLRGEFLLSYRSEDNQGQEIYQPLLSDWDLDAAFLEASDPYLVLRVDIKPVEEHVEEWDIVASGEFAPVVSKESKPPEMLFQDKLFSKMERTISLMQKALNLTSSEGENGNSGILRPLSDAEFRSYLDPFGKLQKPMELRSRIFQGGLEPSLRKVVWKHLLNLYPDGLNGKERMDYMKRKSEEYFRLRASWRERLENRTLPENMKSVTHMVWKDVLRTDRMHDFFKGADDNSNVVALFNILTTYALHHPSVSYCQGMSDLASPLLVTLADEAQAYVAFCGLMTRLKPSFMLDGLAMTTRFQHLTLALSHYDPVFYQYLKQHQADDLLFCYRWLLLEMKREFAFDDALRMLEVMWSSLPCKPGEIALNEVLPNFDYQSPPLSRPKENVYTRVCAMRRQSSSASICSTSSRARCNSEDLLDHSHSLDNDKFQEEEVTQAEEKSSSTSSLSSSSTCPCLAESQDLLGPTSLSSTLKEPLPSPNHLPRSPNICIKKSVNSDPHSLPNGCAFAFRNEDQNDTGTSRRRHETRASGKESAFGSLGSSFDTIDIPPNPERRVQGDCTVNRDSLICRTPVIPVEQAASQSTCSNHNKNVNHSSLPTLTDSGLHDPDPICEEAIELTSEKNPGSSHDIVVSNGHGPFQELPPPDEFGAGNPFLMFLCLTVLLQHRDHIMKNRLDHNELAMYFDRMVRKHDVSKVLQQARNLYTKYFARVSKGSPKHGSNMKV